MFYLFLDISVSLHFSNHRIHYSDVQQLISFHDICGNDVHSIVSTFPLDPCGALVTKTISSGACGFVEVIVLLCVLCISVPGVIKGDYYILLLLTRKRCHYFAKSVNGGLITGSGFYWNIVLLNIPIWIRLLSESCSYF